MEALFESAHIRDKQFFKEWSFFTMYQRTSMMVIHIISILEILLGIFIISRDGDPSRGIGAIVLFTLIELFFFIRHYRMISLSVKREQESAGEKPIIYTVSITADDKIIHKSSLGAEVEFELSQIRYVKLTKSYAFLCTQANQLVVLKKDAFVTGTFEELLDFLREKGLYKKKKR